MRRLEQALDTIAKNSIYSIAFLLFIWPFLLTAFIHVELLLTRLSPLEVQRNPHSTFPNAQALDQNGLAQAGVESKVKKQHSIQFAHIELYSEQHKVLGLRDKCDGVEVGPFSHPSKSFDLPHKKAEEPPFAAACFPAGVLSHIGYLSLPQDKTKKPLKAPGPKGYIVVIPPSALGAGYLLFVESTKDKAHVRWAKLENGSIPQ